MKIITIIGARPQFIKASVVSQAIAVTPGLHEVILHTGQHFDANMSQVFFSELGMVEPAYHLDIHGGGHGAMTGRMLTAIEQVLLDEKPDVVMVYGDTNSTLAGALAAVKLHVPVAHVEAGLRSFNMRMPEEVNRILTDRVSHWLFTPTQAASAHLQHEGCASANIHYVGDVMYDVALAHGGKVQPDAGVFASLGLSPGGYVLATIHRAENTDDPARLRNIMQGLQQAASSLPVVLPLHPRTRQLLAAANMLDALRQRVHVVDPVGYMDMVRLEKYAAVIATDSGGVQKEAFFHQVPCVTLRDETEWVELVESGWNRITPPGSAEVVAQAITSAVGKRGQTVTPYGTGDSAQRIARVLASA